MATGKNWHTTMLPVWNPVLIHPWAIGFGAGPSPVRDQPRKRNKLWLHYLTNVSFVNTNSWFLVFLAKLSIQAAVLEDTVGGFWYPMLVIRSITIVHGLTEKGIFFHTAAVRWVFSLLDAVFCELSRWLWCVENPPDSEGHTDAATFRLTVWFVKINLFLKWHNKWCCTDKISVWLAA